MVSRRVGSLLGLAIVCLVVLGFPTPSRGASSAVEIQDNRYVAPTITITAGDTVTWTETGVGTHSVTADDGSFDSSPACPTSCLGNGSTFSHTFGTPGTYRYYCHIHGGPGGVGMSGVVTVVAPTRIVAVGAQSTERLLDGVVSGATAANVHAHPTSNTTVPADSFCSTVTYAGSAGTGVVVAPNSTDAGRDALRGSVGGSYPDTTSDAGKGCVDIARSDAPPRSVGALGDNASFEYYGYALDAVTWATTSLYAPPALTQAQLQGIYSCTITDWSQVGGTPGTIQRVLPPDGSGIADDFLVEDLGVPSASSLPTSAPGCPSLERIGEDQAYDLLNGSNVYGPTGDAAHYPNAILPVSAGQWTYQASHATNPTVDLRSGVRPGELVVSQGSTSIAAAAVMWTGSNWQLDSSTVVGDTTLVRNVSGLGFTLHGTTVTATVGTFQVGDTGKTLDSPETPNGNIITGVAPDGSSATISPGAQAAGNANGAIGSPIVSEPTVAANGAHGVFPGVHFLYNVVDNTEPSYTAALALVGFRDAVGGTQSTLCNGGYSSDVLDAGFVPLAPRISPSGNTGVTCVKQAPA
jgi:plastocyanin